MGQMTGSEMLRGSMGALAAKLTADTETEASGVKFYAPGVKSVVSDAMGAVAAVDTGKEALKAIAADDGISDKRKAERLAEALNLAEGSARAYVATAQKAADDLRARLDRELIPARPEGVSDALLLDRKTDLTGILDGAKTPEDTLLKALELDREALKDGDALTHHVLAGGPLKLYFERRGVDRGELGGRLAALSNSPASGLVGRLKGKESIPALVTTTLNLVEMDLTALGEAYRPMIANLERRAASK
jgi:hypothetical protein